MFSWASNQAPKFLTAEGDCVIVVSPSRRVVMLTIFQLSLGTNKQELSFFHVKLESIISMDTG